MNTVQSMRHTVVVFWVLTFLLATFLVLAVLTRIAAAKSGEPSIEPAVAYIVSPAGGTFVAGSYPGAEPYIEVGSNVEAGTVVGNVELWGRLHPIRSTVRGTVTEVLCRGDTMVEMGQQLFKVQLESEPNPT